MLVSICCCVKGLWGLHCAGCPGTHLARRRQLLPEGALGGKGRVPVLAAGREPGQCCPACPMGTGTGSVPGTQVPPGHGSTHAAGHLPQHRRCPPRGAWCQNPQGHPVRWFVPRGWRGVPCSPGVTGAPRRCRHGWHSPSQPQHPSLSPCPWASPQAPGSPHPLPASAAHRVPELDPIGGPSPLSPPSLPTAPGCGRRGDGDGDSGCVHLGLSQVSRAGPHPPAMWPRRGCHRTGGFMAVGRTLVTTRAGARGGGRDGGHWLRVVKPGGQPWGQISY